MWLIWSQDQKIKCHLDALNLRHPIASLPPPNSLNPVISLPTQ